MDIFDALPSSDTLADRPGIDLLLTTQVAKREGVDPSTVDRWIEKGLPAIIASNAQLGALVAGGFLTRLPPHKVYLIRESDLQLIPQVRAYPKGTKRSAKGTKTGAGNVERH